MYHAVLLIIFSNTAFAGYTTFSDASHHFSADLQAKFTLLTDSATDPGIVYYVAKQASVDSMDTPTSQPDFIVSTGVSQIPFLPYDSLLLSGAFNTTGSATDFAILQQQANDKGFVLQPAPIIDSKIRFLVTGFVTNDKGTIDPICDLQHVTFSTGETVEVPICYAFDADNMLRPLDFFYNLRTSPIDKFSTTNQTIRFSATLFPQWTADISTLLATGQNWDPYLIGQVSWRVNNGARIPVARVTVNWVELYKIAVDYIQKFQNILTQSEANAFALALTFSRELAIDRRGIDALSIELEPNISLGPWWNPNLELIKAISDSLLSRLTDKAFNTVVAYDPSRDKYIEFLAINVDVDRIDRHPIETFLIYYNNTAAELFVNTDLSIECIYGDIDQPIMWNLIDTRCEDIHP